eukprot:jgi/Undpi1/5910/HiC_scaffold_2.g01184.m1
MRASVRHRRTGGGIFLLLQTLLFFIGSCSSFRVAPAGTRQGGARALPRAVRVRSRRRWQRPQSYRRATMQAAGGLDQDSTPLVDALANAAKNVRSPLFYPAMSVRVRRGMIGGSGRPSVNIDDGRAAECERKFARQRSPDRRSGAPSRLVDDILGGKLNAFVHDLPELPELDNLFAPEGPIRDAELLAADAFGATKTWLLANGSTCGVLSSIIACVLWHNSRPPLRSPTKGGDDANDVSAAGSTKPRRSVVILPRDTHKSAVHALVLSGATPCFLPPLRHRESGVSLGVGTAALKSALKEHGDEVAAVFVVSPTYEGACSDVAAASRACHAAGVPLIVDEAHGAHLAFLGAPEDGQSDPQGAKPPPLARCKQYLPAALQCGADLVVQSAHKTLSSLTQSAFLHLGQGVLTAADGTFSAEQAVSDALATVQSSSPSYLLLASLDAARWDLAGAEKDGRRRLKEAVLIAQGVRAEMKNMEGVNVLELGGEQERAAGFVGTDPLRLTISFDGGIGGYEADELLIDEFGVYAELPAPDSLTFVFGPGSTPDHGQKLVEAMRHVAREAISRQGSASTAVETEEEEGVEAVAVGALVPAVQVCSPREAFLFPSKTVSAHDAIGLASAETVCPYPPGIPTLLPGEIITQEALDALVAVQKGGGVISGCTDGTLVTMRVVDL